MKKVYVVSPYSGAVKQNVEFARKCCRKLSDEGCIPFAPHLLFTQFLDDDIPQERERGIQFGLELMKLCDEVVVCGDYISRGMGAEIACAKDLGIPVRHLTREYIIG